MEINKKLIGFVISTIFGIILIDLGSWIIIQKEKYIGIITALIGLALLYFSYYSPQISSHENRIKEIDEWIENKEEILNTIKDIVILKKVSKIR